MADRTHKAEVLEDEADFSPQWCRDILKDPTYQHVNPSTRAKPPPGSNYNSFMAKTISTPTTLRAMRYLYRPRQDSSSIGGDVVALVSVGSELCSHPDVLHGGMNTVLVDEIAGYLAMREAPPGTNMMAVNFNVNLRKSVKTPGIVVGRAWRERREEGRKWWVKCVLEQDGVQCIDAECMFLTIPARESKM